MKTMEQISAKDLNGIKRVVFNFKNKTAPTFNETGLGMLLLRNVHGFSSSKIELVRTKCTEYQWEYWGGKIIDKMKVYSKDIENISFEKN